MVINEANKNQPLNLGHITEIWGELRKVSTGQALLCQRVEDHIARSDQTSLTIVEIKDDLTKVTAELGHVYRSMPEDTHGKPSLFKHKNHHLILDEQEKEDAAEKRDAIEDRRKIRRTFWESAASVGGKILMLVVAAVVLGEKFPALLKTLIGG